MSAYRILITGASGFIGRQVLAHLPSDYDIHVMSRHQSVESAANVSAHHGDFLRGDACDFIQKLRPTHLMHLAWVTEHGQFWSHDDNIAWMTNSVDALKAFGHSGGKRAVI